MRTHWLALAGVLVLGGPLAAQQNPQAPPARQPDPAAQQKLDGLLLRWENEMKAIQSLVAQCNRTTLNKAFRTTEVAEGQASFLKPNMAMLNMRMKERPDKFELFICAGTKVYEYDPTNRVVRLHEMSPPKNGQIADDNFLSFLFGMKAEEAKRRYTLWLDKEDQFYYYLMVLPKFVEDKADFQKARLVLNKQSFLPRELWFMAPNGDEVRWDIPRIDNGARLNADTFNKPQLPPGWTMQQVPRAQTAPSNNVPPRVARPNG